MRKIFSILVVSMAIGLTFMSCKPTTGSTDTGSSAGINTTASLNEFINNTLDDVNRSDTVYSGKIKGTNDYVLIPTKASIGELRKESDTCYSFGNAELIKLDVTGCENMNIYFYKEGQRCYFSLYGCGPYTIGLSSGMWEKYFDDDYIGEHLKIGGETIYIKL